MIIFLINIIIILKKNHYIFKKGELYNDFN